MLRRGKRSRTSHLDVFDSPSPLPFGRVGLIVPRYKRTVVQRNRLKRRLREIARRELLPRLDAAGRARDVLVRARREAYDASFAELSGQIMGWTERVCSRASC